MTAPGSLPPAPHLFCPLCGGPNQCAPAASGDFATPCWCQAEAVSIAPERWARLPEAQRRVACLCPVCAGVGGNSR